VHCWGGLGRTGLVVACWLRGRHGYDGPAALAALAELRQQDRLRGHQLAPETEQQRAFVQSWKP
jgi:protein-tyrosine phosphatase